MATRGGRGPGRGPARRGDRTAPGGRRGPTRRGWPGGVGAVSAGRWARRRGQSGRGGCRCARGPFRPGTALVDAGDLDAAWELAAALSDAGEAIRLRCRIAWLQGRTDVAGDLARDAIALARTDGDRPGEGIAWTMAGDVAIRTGDGQGALEAYDRAMTLLVAPSELPARARLVYNRATALYHLDRADEALAAMGEALDLSRAAGLRQHEGRVLAGLSTVYTNQQRVEAALPLIREAITIHRETGDRLREAYEETNLASILIGLDRLEEAAELCERSLATIRAAGAHRYLTWPLSILGSVRLSQGDVDASQRLAEEAVDNDARSGDRVYSGDLLIELAALHRLRGDREAAATRLAEAWSAWENGGNRYTRALCLAETVRQGIAWAGSFASELDELRQMREDVGAGLPMRLIGEVLADVEQDPAELFRGEDPARWTEALREALYSS